MSSHFEYWIAQCLMSACRCTALNAKGVNYPYGVLRDCYTSLKAEAARFESFGPRL